MEKDIDRIEENFKNKEIRNFYQDVKKENRPQNKTVYPKDINGQLIGGTDKKIEREPRT